MESDAQEPQTARRASQFVIEVAVIVAGIAIALGADAAWEYRQERVYEHMALQQLASEFSANAAQFDSVLTRHRLLESATLELIAATEDDPGLSTDSIRALLGHVDTWWTFNPKSGALGSLLGSGGLNSIQNDSLRVELAGWPGLVEDYQENESQVVTYAMGYQADYLQSTGLFGELYFPTNRADGLRDLLDDPMFRDVIIGRWAFLPDLLEEAASVEAALRRIRGLIDSELNG